MSECVHEKLDPSHQKISAPPWMRCEACGEWVHARGYCHECGRKGTASYERFGAQERVTSRHVALPEDRSVHVYRLRCSVCRAFFGPSHVGYDPATA